MILRVRRGDYHPCDMPWRIIDPEEKYTPRVTDNGMNAAEPYQSMTSRICGKDEQYKRDAEKPALARASENPLTFLLTMALLTLNQGSAISKRFERAMR